LPSVAQTDLARWKTWYTGNFNNEKARLTLLNVYLKLKKGNLWRYVKGPGSQRMGEGNIEIQATNVNAFKTALDGRNDFVGPDASSDKWSAREHKVMGSLHFKHNKDWGHAVDEVQVHIDTFGLRSLLFHGYTQEGYKNPYGIRNVLNQQGYDKAVLFGKPIPVTQRITVPAINITGRKPLPRLRKIKPAVPPGIIPGEDIGDILNRLKLGEARKYVPPLKPHTAGVPPAYRHNVPPQWKIPRGQKNPFPSQLPPLSMRQRQNWLRQYYKTNPIAAQRARNEAKTIISHARTHLGSPSTEAIHDARRRHIPIGQMNPYPSQVSKLPMGQRQGWLRTYYQVNPRAANQARNDARTIINLAHTHLR